MITLTTAAWADPTDREHVSNFFLRARNGVICGVYTVTEADWQRICVSHHENCGPSPISWVDLEDYESGRYCPGAFHPVGWPENLCPVGRKLQSSGEVSASGSGVAECLFRKYLKTIATCGRADRWIFSACNDIEFGVDVAAASAAVGGSDPRDVALGNLLLSYNAKVPNGTPEPLISQGNQRMLQNCLWQDFSKPTFITFAQFTKQYIDGLVKAPSETDFMRTLINNGC
jgi:hypothetical protein